MWGTSLIIVTLHITHFVCSSSFESAEQLKSIFGRNICIKGSLSTITPKITETLVIKDSTSFVDVYTNTTSKESLENVLSKLNELAQFNEVDYYFKLIKEEGPPHNKLFTISLTLGDEEYAGEGSSLKIAKQRAAAVALKNSEYEPPVLKEKEENVDTTTPTVLLNNLCAKLGIGVEYFIPKKDDKVRSTSNDKLKKSYIQKLNDSLDSEINIRKDETQPKGPFKIGVQVGKEIFYGNSHTIQSARHDAASKAIDYLIKEVQDGNSVCLKEGSEDECKKAKANLKSPISLVYEAAQLRNLKVEFEIIDESGPAHKREFTTECVLGHLSTTGQGKSKKESKREAAKNMLERVSELPEVSQAKQVNGILKDKKKKNKKKKVLKTNFDVINMHVDNIISTIKEYGLPSDDSEVGPKTKSPKQKPSTPKKSFQDEILELSNILKFEVQFMDFDDEKQSNTIMSLFVDPEYICLGQGSSSKVARNKAAKGGLMLLQDIDFENHFKNKKLVFLESEIKQKINMILNKEIHEDLEDSPKY